MARPNIVFILADDLGWADLGCYGSSFYETPVLDRLASEGMRFTDAYAAGPVCSPTRASLLSGKYPAHVGVTQFIGGHAVGKLADVPYYNCLPTSEYALPHALREGGYQTWNVGKWHLGSAAHTLPERHGFDVNIGGTGHGHPPLGYFAPYGLHNLPDGPDEEYLTDRLTDEAITLIENAGKRPFFLHLSHYAVHTPIQAPEHLVAKYRRKAECLGLDQAETFADGEMHPARHKQPERVRRRLLQSDPAYAAMVENLDTNVGRLLDALDAAGHAESTVVIFTSDNGGLATAEGSPTCNAPLAEGKGWTAEGGFRVPFLVRWPGATTPGSVTSEPITSPDVYPTLLEIAGLPERPDQHTDGISFTSLLRGQDVTRGPIFWHYPHYSNQGGAPTSAVRDGRWKLIEHFEDCHLELYDLCTDLSEEINLADHPEHTATRNRLHTALVAWRDRVGARIPEANLYG